MAIYREDLVDVELTSGTVHRSFLSKTIGEGDNLENRYGVRLFRDGEAVNVGEATVQGLFIAPDGTGILISGVDEYDKPLTGKDGNKAWVQLPQACYNKEGQFTLTIKLIESAHGITGTMRIVDGVISNTMVQSPVAPTDTVPTYEEIIAIYEDMLATIASAVRYDTAQSLTESEKTQARENIEANTEVGLFIDSNGYICQKYTTT